MAQPLRAILGTDEIIIGDLMLCEVLQGLDGERAARQVEALLRRFDIVPMAGDAIVQVTPDTAQVQGVQPRASSMPL